MANRISRLMWRSSVAAVVLAAVFFDPTLVSPGQLSSDGRAFAQAPGGGAEKEAFEAAKELGTVEAWDAFLANYPSGFHADLARAYVKKLAEQPVQAPASQPQYSSPAAQRPAPYTGEYPVEAGSWGGIVRSGPGQGYAKLGSLQNGDDIALIATSPELDNGYPWFKVWFGPQQTKGYIWGGILCSKGAERPDLYKTCSPQLGFGSERQQSGEGSSNGGSFCAQPGNDAERMICANSELSGLDAQLNSEFSMAVSNITSEANGGTKADVERFRQAQRSWLRQRDGCGSDYSCLKSTYQSRLRALRAQNQPE